MGGEPSHQRKPTSASPSYTQPRIQGGVGSPIQLFSRDVLQNWFDFKQFRLLVPQFIMALDDKSAPFVYHSVIHMVKMSPQTQTEGVSGTSQSYLSFTASRNSLLFKSKSLSLIGKTVSQLNAPFRVAIKSHSSQNFCRNRAPHLIKLFLQILILQYHCHPAVHVSAILFVELTDQGVVDATYSKAAT